MFKFSVDWYMMDWKSKCSSFENALQCESSVLPFRNTRFCVFSERKKMVLRFYGEHIIDFPGNSTSTEVFIS